VKRSYGFALATLLVALGAGPAFANEVAAPAAPAASNSYRESATPIDCHRAPGRALSMLRDGGMSPCNRDGVPAVAPRSAATPRTAETARPAQSSVTAAPPEAQSAVPRVDRAECPTQVAGQPEKRPRHLLFLHLT
jgi:hypothetical protein